MFNIVDIVSIHNRKKHAALENSCKRYAIKSKNELEKRFGQIPREQCEFDGAYNGIISRKSDDNELETYVIGDMVLLIVNDKCCCDEFRINALLVVHVLSQHSSIDYGFVQKLGIWDKNGDLGCGCCFVLETSNISARTIDSVSYTYIGYNKNEDVNGVSSGTDKNCLYEAVRVYKHHPKYIDKLHHFEYQEEDDTCLMRFDTTETQYPILREENTFLPVPAKFGGNSIRESISVNYISDIHLEHHIDFAKPIDAQIKNIGKFLHDSKKKGLVFFGGDIAHTPELSQKFYHAFIMCHHYEMYKQWRKKNERRNAMTKKQAEQSFHDEFNHLQEQLVAEIRHIKPWFDYNRKFAKKSVYEMANYINGSYYRKRRCPDFVAIRLRKIKRLESQIEGLETHKKDYIQELQTKIEFKKSKLTNMYAVIGNHECAGFDSVEAAREYYRELFEVSGIHFLDNCIMTDNKYVIVGGCGFAKYNQEFNANNCLNARRFTREDEYLETEVFETVYHKALEQAKAQNKPLIVLSHFPTKDFLENDECDSHAVYFTGHTHRNDSEHNKNRHIYADNQIGYHRKTIEFRLASIGTIANPFNDYEDGCYEVTPFQYEEFYRYNDDKLNGTTLIGNAIRSGSRFIMIKHLGFYGFFLVHEKRGINICVGGRIKKIDGAKSVEYLIDNFDGVVNKYLTGLLPFRKAQEKISSKLQSLGFSGKIHGCIVDVDYFNHIMLNPFDGTLTYYFSPTFGTLKTYQSFMGMLEDMSTMAYYLDEKETINAAKKLIADSSNGLVLKESLTMPDGVGEMVHIEIKGSLYEMSAKVNQLQRLFTSRVLRDWNSAMIQERFLIDKADK